MLKEDVVKVMVNNPISWRLYLSWGERFYSIERMENGNVIEAIPNFQETTIDLDIQITDGATMVKEFHMVVPYESITHVTY